MNSSRRQVLLVAGVLCAGLVASVSTQAAILQWGTSDQLLYAQNGSDLLTGNPAGPPPTTAMIQLLHIGTEAEYDSPETLTPGTNGDGTFGDDTVIAQSWVGDGQPALVANGAFSATDQPGADSYTSGVDDFVIRVFDTAVSEADWNAGNIPTSGYYNYFLFENPTKTAGDYQLAIDGVLATTRQVIPEPSTSLLLLGAVAVLARRRPRR